STIMSDSIQYSLNTLRHYSCAQINKNGPQIRIIITLTQIASHRGRVAHSDIADLAESLCQGRLLITEQRRGLGLADGHQTADSQTCAGLVTNIVEIIQATEAE